MVPRGFDDFLWGYCQARHRALGGDDRGRDALALSRGKMPLPSTEIQVCPERLASFYKISIIIFVSDFPSQVFQGDREEAVRLF